ncbi:MAG: hypothetical protein ACKVP4_01260 [Hyphomicrobium sp.]
MIDILLTSIIQNIINPRWWLAVFGGAACALLFVGLLIYVGFLAA